MKSDIKSELNDSINSIKTLGAVLRDIKEFSLPNSGGVRTILKFKKNVKTNVKYPRKFNEIKKKPL